MDERNVRSALFDQLARIGRAVGSAGRLEILELLSQGEKTVEALAQETGMRVGNTSAHLRALREARLVETRREGVYVYYRVADPAVVDPLLGALQAVAERRLLEVREMMRRHFAEGSEERAVAGRALAERVERGEVTLVDVRPADEYRSAHIAGARCIPVEELAERMGELPRERAVVVYCRGRYSPLSVRAVAVLRAGGYRATRLTAGVAEWRVAGLPLRSGDQP